ncbi:MAG: porin [Burkholderiales bacterium]|nr:porin [Burkholderiales bacterium]
MRISSVLLGSAAAAAAAAALAVAGSATAADLPSRKAAPVEYVRACAQFGTGFFFIPGSDTCLRFSGRVRADYIYAEPFARSTNALTFRSRGYIGLDSFTATDWGPVRATTRLFVTKDTGSAYSTTLDWGYIQFAGITAGRIATSFFEFAPFGGVSILGGNGNGRGSDYGSINTLAYTITAGKLTATLALEDGTERQTGLQNFNAAFGAASTPTFGGQVVPDVVGRLDYTDTWGQLSLSGAVHQSRVGNGNVPGSVNLTPVATILDTTYGFAIRGGVKVNLPMLAPGDALFLEAAYADGANSYTGWNQVSVGTLAPATWDVVYDATGNAKASQSWSITGGLQHFWTPTIRQGVFAGYGELDQYGPLYDTAAFSVGSNIIWSPVRGFVIGAEVVYSKLTQTPRNLLPLAAGNSDDSWSGRLRFQHDF